MNVLDPVASYVLGHARIVRLVSAWRGRTVASARPESTYDGPILDGVWKCHFRQ
jgi:hypothetical protein